MNVSFTAGDVIRVRHYCYNPETAQVGINVVHYRCVAIAGGGTVPFILDNLAASFSQPVAANYAVLLPNICAFLGTEAQKISPTVSVSDGSDDNAAQGTIDDDPLPNQVAGLIRWRTSVAGRSGRGRIYVPFPTELDSATPGRPDPVYVGNLDDLANAMLGTTSVTDGSEVMTVALHLWSPTLEQSFAITDVIGMPKWATQRRRGDFGRLNALPTWFVTPLPIP